MTNAANPKNQLSASVVAAEKQANRTRAFLLAPGVLTILLIGILPLSIVLTYSFMVPGDYGGVKAEFSIDAYVQLVFEEDIFDETMSFTSSYLQIFGRSLALAIFATVASLLVGFPTAYFIATRTPETRAA